MKVLRPIYLIMAFVTIVGLACLGSSGTPSQPAPVATQAPQQPATQAPASTSAPSSQQYFTTDFSGTLKDWSYTVVKGDESQMKITPGSSGLAFDLEGTNLWVYVTYDPYTYTDVALDVKADNRGKNKNNITLLCRYSDEGWYEFDVYSNGYYEIAAFDAKGIVSKGYNDLVDGASLAIKQGRDTNDISASCVGDKLSLSANGVAIKTWTDTKFKLAPGKIGFSVSSFDIIPVLINITSLTVSQP